MVVRIYVSVRIYVGVYTCAETAYMSGNKSLKNVKNHGKGKYAITKVTFWPNIEHDSWSWSKVSYSRTQHAGPRRVQTHDPEIMNPSSTAELPVPLQLCKKTFKTLKGLNTAK